MDGPRIDSIEAIALDIPLTRNFGGSTYSVLKRSTVVTRLRTADGLISAVYNGDNRAHGPEIARLVREVLAPRVIGLSIMEGERIWERCFALTHSAGTSRALMMEAIACVDSAVWDVVGKALGQPVRALLGGYREQLPIISSTWANRPAPRDGWFDAGAEPGFGIVLDEGMLQRYRVG